MLRQAVFGRLAGYEDVNDAERLRHDPAMRWIVGGKAAHGCAASASQMWRFETRWLTAAKNLSALADLSGQWIDEVHGRRPPRGVVLDMDSSVSPTPEKLIKTGAKIVSHGRDVAFQVAEVAIPRTLFGSRSCGRHRLYRQRNTFGQTFHEKPRETCVLMQKLRHSSARNREPAARDISTSRGWVSTTFQSCQNLAVAATSARVRLSSGECRINWTFSLLPTSRLRLARCGPIFAKGCSLVSEDIFSP
jgi:hypothetical protein